MSLDFLILEADTGGPLDLLQPVTRPLTATGSKLVLSDVLVIIGVCLLIGAIMMVGIVVWMKRFRKKRTRTSAQRYRPVSKTAGTEVAETGHHRAHRRRRRRRRNHRQRNPTLAETGGLPPVRAGEAEKPPGS